MAKSTIYKAKVYMDFINFVGEVYNSAEIAEFRSMEWAEEFYRMAVAKTYEDGSIRYRIEEIK